MPLVTVVAGAALVLVFALWWLYFLQPVGGGARPQSRAVLRLGLRPLRRVRGARRHRRGAGVAVAQSGGLAAASSVAVGYAIAVPVAMFLALVWALHLPFR